MTESHTTTKAEYNPQELSWLERYKPSKRILKGNAYLIAKRVMDLALVILGAPLWLPITALVALAIKLQSPHDPVLFIQERTGKNGSRFGMYKFRTMVANAEALKEKYAHLNELKWPDFKITNDPRVTRLGRFLRKTSLDEFPQFFNVLRGEMSLVGPRPTSFSPENYALWHTSRLDVPPGLTGLWQITGRGESQFDERLRLDIAYIDRRCISLDFQIILRTVLSALKQRGAH